MRSPAVSHQKLTMTSWEQSSKLILLKLHKLPKNSMLTILWSFGHLEFEANGKVKKLSKWVPHELTQNKKYHCFEVLFLLFYATTMNDFLIGLWCAKKSWLYIITSNDQLSGWTKNKLQSTSKSQTRTKKKAMVTVGWSAASPILNPSRTITSEKYAQQINEVHWNFNACSRHWSTERAQFFCKTTPDCTSHNQCFKSWTKWAMKFCLICHTHLTSHQPITTSSSLSTTFHRKTLKQPAGGRKCFPRVCWILKLRVLHCRNKQTYFSLAKMCWL